MKINEKDTPFSKEEKKVFIKYFSRAISESRFSTPRNICSINRTIKIQQQRRRRILRELHYAALMTDLISDTYDQNIVILPFSSCLEAWHAFLKGEELTLYEASFVFIPFIR